MVSGAEVTILYSAGVTNSLIYAGCSAAAMCNNRAGLCCVTLRADDPVIIGIGFVGGLVGVRCSSYVSALVTAVITVIGVLMLTDTSACITYVTGGITVVSILMIAYL